MSLPSLAEVNQVHTEAESLFTETEVEEALNRMAVAIAVELAESNPLVLCVMTGGIIATGQLLIRLHFPLNLDYIHATRYRNDIQGQAIEWVAKPRYSLENRVVLIVDDILDEGITLAAVQSYCRDSGAKKVYTAVLCEKLHNRKALGVQADFVGLQLPDRYVFGYGLDYKSYLRNANGIFAVNGL